jgi:O-antigen/teichoic acid export membrane protein
LMMKSPRPPLDSLTSRSILRSSAYNVAGEGIPLLVSLALTPLLISRLGIERFGLLTLVWVLIGYFSLFDLGLGRALTAAVAERSGDRRDGEIPAVVRTSVGFLLLLGVVAGVVLEAVAPWLAGMLNVGAAFQPEILGSLRLIAIGIPIVAVTTALKGVLEARHRFGVVNALRIPLGVTQFAGPLVVTFFTSNLVVVVAVLVLARLVACAAHLVACIVELPSLLRRTPLQPGVLLPLLRWGGWMTVSQVIGPLMVSLDRFLIGSWLGARALAFYATPNDLVTRSSFVPDALVRVLFPAFAARSATTALLFDRATRLMLVCLAPGIVFVVALAPEGLSLWLGTEFSAHGTPVLRWLAIGVLFNSVARIPFALVQGVGRPDLTAWFHLAQLIPYLLLLAILLKTLGITGAAIAWTLRSAVDAALLFLVAPRFVQWPIPARRRFLGTMLVVVTVSAGATILPSTMMRSLYVLLFTVCAIATSWAVLLAPAEKAGIKAVLRGSMFVRWRDG